MLKIVPVEKRASKTESWRQKEQGCGQGELREEAKNACVGLDTTDSEQDRNDMWHLFKPMKPVQWCVLPASFPSILHVNSYLSVMLSIAIFSALLGLSHVHADVYVAMLTAAENKQ